MAKPVRFVKCEYEKIKDLIDGDSIQKVDVYLNNQEGILYFIPKNDLGTIQDSQIDFQMKI